MGRGNGRRDPLLREEQRSRQEMLHGFITPRLRLLSVNEVRRGLHSLVRAIRAAG